MPHYFLNGSRAVHARSCFEYYAAVYAEITKNAKAHFTRYYIDGFANRGLSRLRDDGRVVQGSALRLLNLRQQFDRYVFVEKNAKRMADLKRNVGHAKNVEFVEADANVVLPGSILPGVRYERYERALCFLDPYNMRGLRWTTIAASAGNRAIDGIIHFPTMDAHRTVLLADEGKIRPAMRAKMNAYWGDESWLDDLYSLDGMLPMDGLTRRKREPGALIEAFKKRLITIGGYLVVSNGIPMRNTKGNVVYHLLVGSHSAKAAQVIRALEKRFIAEKERP